MASTTSTIVAALVAAGLPLLEAEATQLEKDEPAVNDAIVAGAVGAVVKALPTNGILALVDGGLKTAMVAAEPSLEASLGDLENSFIADIEAYIAKAA
jgi:hypothetical protein